MYTSKPIVLIETLVWNENPFYLYFPTEVKRKELINLAHIMSKEGLDKLTLIAGTDGKKST